MDAAVESMLGRVLEPLFRTLPSDTIRQIVALQADDQLHKQVEEFARKANEGELTADEERAYASIVDAGDILATLQALARRTLQQTTN
jgi:hypothetical protein